MLTVEGKCGISATIVADSINGGQRMTTMEIVYPRFILAELNTHRMLSKNSASSRAIPADKMREQIASLPATPVFWGKNQPGMSAREQLDDFQKVVALDGWRKAMFESLYWSKQLADLGVHKQITNRVTEPWMMMKTVISGTEWENLFWLRDHEDAQPEFGELARCMKDLMHFSRPNYLNVGEWHLPYVEYDGEKYYSGGEVVDLETAKKISVSCCAQVSYRKNDNSVDKAEKIFDMLNLNPGNRQAHASPTEHQATPMPVKRFRDLTLAVEDSTRYGISHIDMAGYAWSGNLKGWGQYRKMIGF